MRKNNLLEAHVRAQLIRKRITQEGEIITFNQEELKVFFKQAIISIL
jgi:hypothetical protein